jgi:hypothetical protein
MRSLTYIDQQPYTEHATPTTVLKAAAATVANEKAAIAAKNGEGNNNGVDQFDLISSSLGTCLRISKWFFFT